MKFSLKCTILGSVLLSISSFCASAQTAAGGEQLVDPCQSGSQYLAYPRPAYGLPTLTKAPKGYAPFHMEHYGRHGSRWLLNDDKYDQPVKFLQKAADNGKLTERGTLLLSQLKEIQTASRNRVGELTPLGHRQHRDIARRMTENFPELFKAGTHVDAKSTVVIRCILSMANEIAELQRICPELTVTCDASRTYQKILAPNSTDQVAKDLGKEASKRIDRLTDKAFEKAHSDHSAFIAKVFNDPEWVNYEFDHNEVFESIFDVAVNTQSHDDQPDLYDLFTPEELHNQWLINNAWWYVNYANSSITNNRIPYMQRTLLNNIIESADSAMTSPRQSVNLRFGHESIVLPLSVLMELNNSAYDTSDIDNLAKQWRNYEIFAMGSNIQIIFYRPVKKAAYTPDEVLVKVLLNEEEATLPLTAVEGPYYKWTDVRNFYTTKLEDFKTRFAE